MVKHFAVRLQDVGDALGGGRAVGFERSTGLDAVGSSALSLLCLRFDPPAPRTREIYLGCLMSLDLPTVAQSQLAEQRSQCCVSQCGRPALHIETVNKMKQPV